MNFTTLDPITHWRVGVQQPPDGPVTEIQIRYQNEDDALNAMGRLAPAYHKVYLVEVTERCTETLQDGPELFTELGDYLREKNTNA